MSLKDTAEKCDDIAAVNGFDPPSWDNIVVKLALVGTELGEARDGALGFGEGPLNEELADTAIRLLSILHSLWGRDWGDRVTSRKPKNLNTFAPIEVLLWPILGSVFKAIEERRHDSQIRTCQWIELALLETFRLADALSIDLDKEIEIKCNTNKGRGHLHGKSYAGG